jgi:hypothetical protein
MKKQGLLYILLIFPFLIYAQQRIGSIKDYVDLKNYSAWTTEKKKVYVMEPDEIYIVNLVEQGAETIIRTDRFLKIVWEYKLHHEELIDELAITDDVISFFAQGTKKDNTIYLRQLSRANGKQITEKPITTQDRTKATQNKNDLKKNGMAWFLGIPDTGKDKVFYAVFFPANDEIFKGEITLGINNFSSYEYLVIGEEVYMIGQLMNKKKTGDLVGFRYNYKTKELRKDIILAADKDEKKLDIMPADESITDEAYSKIVRIKTGKKNVYKLIHYNFKTGVSTIHLLEHDNSDDITMHLDCSKLYEDKNNGNLVAVYMDQESKRINLFKINASTGAQISKGSLTLEKKFPNFPKFCEPIFLPDGKLLVNIEVTHANQKTSYMGQNNAAGRPIDAGNVTGDIHYYAFNPDCSLLRKGIIEKKTYSPWGKYLNSSSMIGHTSIKASNGIYYFYCPHKKPVSYTLLDYEGNILKKDIPITTSMNSLKKNTVFQTSLDSYLFFGLESDLSSKLFVEHLKITP